MLYDTIIQSKSICFAKYANIYIYTLTLYIIITVNFETKSETG